MDEDLLIAPFKGVVAVQVRDFIGEIELVLWSAYTVLPAISQASCGSVTPLIVMHTKPKPGVCTRIYAVPPGIRGCRSSGRISGNGVTRVGGSASPKVIHPTGIRSVGPSSRVLVRAPETQSTPVRVDRYRQLLSSVSICTRTHRNGGVSLGL